MRLVTFGKACNITSPIVGRILRSTVGSRPESVLLVKDHVPIDKDLSGYRAVITTAPPDRSERFPTSLPSVTGLRDQDHLRDGDVVVLEPSGTVRTLYRPDSVHNSLFVTERCNCNCLMCPQPPRDEDDVKHFQEINNRLVCLIDPATTVLGITGGEPTLLRDDLCTLIETLKARLPQIHIQLLTNGRLFAWPDFTARFASVDHPSLLVAVSLCSDIVILHDYIVQAKGAFDQTILGLHQLARWHQQIEIRIVLHRLTVSRLVPLVEYIYRNLTFAVHVALMGMEPTGYARYHRAKLDISAEQYQDALKEAVGYLSIRGMPVSLYNLPLCVLPESLWKFARRSISDWKVQYPPACDECSQKDKCGGLFSSDSDHAPSFGLRPL